MIPWDRIKTNTKKFKNMLYLSRPATTTEVKSIRIQMKIGLHGVEHKPTRHL